MTHSNARAAMRLATFLIVTGGLLPFYLLVFPLGGRARRLFSYLFYRNCVYLAGLTIQISGSKAAGEGILFASNHTSYLDIPILATLADGMFVAKNEVRDWPLFGFLAKIGRTEFVTRRATTVPSERLSIANLLAQGESVFLFPEGSSSDGTGVLPFRAGLLSAALVDDKIDVNVQPVSIVYGPGLVGEERDRYAWYGDMELAPHLWRVFGLSEKIVVCVHFHSTRLSSEFADRRALAQWAEKSVADGVDRALNDRDVQSAPEPCLVDEVPVYAVR